MLTVSIGRPCLPITMNFNRSDETGVYSKLVHGCIVYNVYSSICSAIIMADNLGKTNVD